jgi:glycosyltransferase involved in cell wall biosynthesis
LKAKPSICFVAHNAFGVIANVDTGHIGGIEVQVPMMARWFVNEGFDVSLITWDEGDEYADGEKYGGVTNYKICKRTDGIPILRFLYPRWTSLRSALNRSDADIVYYNCGDLGLGQVVHWAHARGKKVMYSVAAIVDCQIELPSLKPIRERVLYKYGLRRADTIIVQTETQRELLASNFQLNAKVIPMPSEGFAEKAESYPAQEATKGVGNARRVLWVGRFQEEKRIEWLLDLAELCPEYEFDVVGSSNSDSDYAMKMTKRAESIANVHLHGRVPHEQLGKFYTRAHLLCSTSVYEGFPNVFLEAWSVGLPLVTTVDPDGVVAKYGMGCNAVDVEDLGRQLLAFENWGFWHTSSVAAKSYYEEKHSISSAMSQFKEEVLLLA